MPTVGQQEMGLSELKDTLTILGAILGTIAFFQNFFKPLADFDKSKWKELKQVITEDDFSEIEAEIDGGHMVPVEREQRLDSLVYAIRRRSEITQFKTNLADP